MLEVTDQDFFEKIIKADKPAIVDFYAEWCAPCKVLAPELEELSQKYDGKIIFAKMSVEKNQQIPGSFGVMGIPAVLAFKNGKIVEQIAGTIEKSKVQKVIDEKLLI